MYSRNFSNSYSAILPRCQRNCHNVRVSVLHLSVLLLLETDRLPFRLDWYSFLNRCLDCSGVIRRFDLAVNDMCGLLDIPVLSEKYRNGGAECRCKNYENVQSGKLGGKNRNLASILYIGSKTSTKYFCLYEKQKEQATKKKHTDSRCN